MRLEWRVVERLTEDAARRSGNGAPLTLGYVRVSTEDQAAERKSSLDQQRSAIGALALQLGHTLPAEAVFADPGGSGATAEGRPGFMALLRHCAAQAQPPGAPGLVLVLNDSRWGRFTDPEEATYWRHHLRRLGWIVRFAEGETDDPLARAVLRTVHAAQASAYREAIRANSRRGARGAAARGLWQNEAPLGYRRCAARPSEPGRVLEAGQRKADDEETRLVPGPRLEQDLIRYVFTRYATGTVSLGMLVRELASRWPARRWSRATLGAVLKNPAYGGDIIWCRRRRVEHGRQTPAPAEEWVTVRAAHPALVSRALFAEVQARLAVNRKQSRATRGGYPLSGLLLCAHCGEPYMGSGGPRGPAGDPDRYRFYRDRGADSYDGRPPRCPGPSGTLQKRWIEPRVVRIVAAAVASPAVERAIGAELDRQLAARALGPGTRRAELERERKALEAERDRVVAAVGRGLLEDREAAPTLAKLRMAISEGVAASERLQFDHRSSQAAAADRTRLLALASDFAAVAARAGGAQLRELLRPWIARAIVDKVNRRVHLEIRCVPALGVASELASPAGPDSQEPKTLRRTLALPPRRRSPRRRSVA